MKFYLVDDDPAVLNILSLIIREQGLGSVCGTAANGQEALEDLAYCQPDLVLADLLMPVLDGVEFVRQAKQRYPQMQFIMLSQVTTKEMVAAAYEAGVEFFIHKPVNAVEVLNVVQRVQQYTRSNSALQKMRALLQTEQEPAVAAAPEEPQQLQRNVEQVLQRLGISGYPASRDLVQAVTVLVEQLDQGLEPTVAELCAAINPNPKTTEQRMRRAVSAGLTNLAHLGLEDYANEIFQEYAHSFYQFEQVRREMDQIRGKSELSGRASLKQFLYALADKCRHV